MKTLVVLIQLLIAAPLAHANNIVTWMSGTFTINEDDHPADPDDSFSTTLSDGRFLFHLQVEPTNPIFGVPEELDTPIEGDVVDGYVMDLSSHSIKESFLGIVTRGADLTKITERHQHYEWAGIWTEPHNRHNLKSSGNGLGDEGGYMNVTTVTPEPSTLLMLGSGLLSCTWWIRSRRAKI